MKALVTGSKGFIGTHLVDYLLKKRYHVLATYHKSTTSDQINPQAEIEECDVRDKDRVFGIIRGFRPDRIFHLAAQSYPTISWEDPWYTLQTNVLGTANVFEAVKRFSPSSIILNAGSSGEYGDVNEKDIPVRETQSFRPLHPYGVSKVAQELLAYSYHRNFDVKSITVRIFNATGPGKVNDVCSDFTKRLTEMEKSGLEKRLRVGNLDARRSITDVRDVIRAFDLLLMHGRTGEAYNVSGEKAYGIREIIGILRELVNFDFEIRQDPSLIRPTEEPVIYGDSSKLKKETGWQQEIQLETTLKDMLNYWGRVL